MKPDETIEARPEHKMWYNRLRTLRRRLVYLETVTSQNPKTSDMIKGERGAIKWALPILEEWSAAKYKEYATNKQSNKGVEK